MSNICCNCGSKFSNNALFCIKCGERIVTPIVQPILKQKLCTNCNESILYNSLFCSNCGAKIDSKKDKIDINKLVNNITEHFRNSDEDNLEIINKSINKDTESNLNNSSLENTLNEDIYKNSKITENLSISSPSSIKTYTQDEYLESISDTYNEDDNLEYGFFDKSNNIYEENLNIADPYTSTSFDEDDHYPQEAYSEGYILDDEYYLESEDNLPLCNNKKSGSFTISSKDTISVYNKIDYEDKDIVNAAIIVAVITLITFCLWVISVLLEKIF